MAIELKNKITFKKTTTMYGHNGLDEAGTPSEAGNATVKDILECMELAFSVDADNNRLYKLKLFDTEIASFEVPVDKFIKSVSYDTNTRELVFVFYKADETEEEVRVNISDLVDTYTAGNGLTVSNNQFALKIKSGETHLKVDSNGAYTDLSDKSDIGHTHDDRYYTESEVDSKLSGKSDTSHTHDDRYYTESEIDTKVSALNTSIGTKANSSDVYTKSEVDTKFTEFKVDLPLAVDDEGYLCYVWEDNL